MKSRKALSRFRQLNYCFYLLSEKEQKKIKQEFYTKEFEGIYHHAKDTGYLELLWIAVMDKSSPEIRVEYQSEEKTITEGREKLKILN